MKRNRNAVSFSIKVYWLNRKAAICRLLQGKYESNQTPQYWWQIQLVTGIHNVRMKTSENEQAVEGGGIVLHDWIPEADLQNSFYGRLDMPYKLFQFTSVLRVTPFSVNKLINNTEVSLPLVFITSSTRPSPCEPCCFSPVSSETFLLSTSCSHPLRLNT